MSKKHNVRKTRSRSRYPERLAARGISTAQTRMPFIDRYGKRYGDMTSMLRREGGEVSNG